jgi:UDP-N-acetylmuramoylalanine--D-glutamate ligase
VSGAFAGERVLVVGFGVAGRAAAEVLALEGAHVIVSEARPAHALEPLGEHLRRLGVELRAGGHRAEDLDGIDRVVVSPGVPPSAPLIVRARARGLPVDGELELGARLASAPILAVTGTNGKTTTTEMLAAALRADGLEAVACGNIGHPFPVAARAGHDVLVVECSSFQLAQQTSFHPRVSVLLNLAPDHLDWHGSFEAYARAKAAIAARQEGEDVHVGNRDDPEAAAISRRARCRTIWFTLEAPGPGEVGYVQDRLVARIDEERELASIADARPGLRADAAAAAAAALAFGASSEAIASALASYRPRPHRGEVVAVVEGVRFVDDSKATNVHASLAAIDAWPGAVLIAGGHAKGVDLAPLASRAGGLRAVIAVGAAADEIEAVFAGRLQVRRATSIEEAARLGFELASPEGVVLLAPACASWDQFTDYAERGERFAEAARGLDAEVRAGG